MLYLVQNIYFSIAVLGVLTYFSIQLAARLRALHRHEALRELSTPIGADVPIPTIDPAEYRSLQIAAGNIEEAPDLFVGPPRTSA